MKKILIIVFLLFPSLVLGQSVKVYSCKTIKNIELNSTGMVYTYENFDFILKRKVNELVFSMKNNVMFMHNFNRKNFKLKFMIIDKNETFVYSNNDDKMFTYYDPIFNLIKTNFDKSISMTGTCSQL